MLSSRESSLKFIKSINSKGAAVDEHKKQDMLKREWLKDQILNHDRLDLLMTHVLGYEIKDFHWAMYMGVKHNSLVIENEDKCQKWNLTLAPRGHGKSTILTVSRCIHEVLKNPNIRILIASKTDSNAVSFLSEIKQKLARTELVAIFGNQVGSPWNEGNIRVASRTSESKEDTITTLGLGNALASKHFDLIILDDPIDEDNVRTEGQRDKLKTWLFKVLDPTLEPHGEISIIGTRYHPEDLLGHLIEAMFTKRNKRGKTLKKYYQIFPALMPIKRIKPGTPAKYRYKALWPEKFSVNFLLQKKKSQGTIFFNSQYQNDVEGMKGKIFRWDWFEWYDYDDINIKRLRIFQGVDLAIKQKETADKFAHVTIGVDPKTFNIYILDYYNAVTHYTDQKKVIKQNFDDYDPIRVAIEANGYQRSLLQDMQTDKKLASIRAVPVFTDTDKTVRAWKLSAYFERHQVFFRTGMHEIVQHLLKMPDGRYKDLFDALDIAIQTAFGGAKKEREKEPGII